MHLPHFNQSAQSWIRDGNTGRPSVQAAGACVVLRQSGNVERAVGEIFCPHFLRFPLCALNGPADRPTIGHATRFVAIFCSPLSSLPLLSLV